METKKASTQKSNSRIPKIELEKVDKNERWMLEKVNNNLKYTDCRLYSNGMYNVDRKCTIKTNIRIKSVTKGYSLMIVPTQTIQRYNLVMNHYYSPTTNELILYLKNEAWHEVYIKHGMPIAKLMLKKDIQYTIDHNEEEE